MVEVRKEQSLAMLALLALVTLLLGPRFGADTVPSPEEATTTTPTPAPRRSARHLLSELVGEQSRRENVSVRTVVVTVPDPKESLLDRSFDEAVESIRKAAAAAGWVLDRYASPWHDADAATRAPPRPELRTGTLLFRRPAGSGDGRVEALAVLLVGETPISGLPIETTTATLREALRLNEELGAVPGPRLSILGPYFSGSSFSLSRALRALDAEIGRRPAGLSGPGPVPVEIVSGSATAFSNRRVLEEELGSATPNLAVSFRATVLPDEALLGELYAYLQDHGVEARDVVELVETSTAWGSGLQRFGRSARAEAFRPLQIGFGMHLPQVRAGYDRERTPGSGRGDATPPSRVALPLGLGDVARRSDNVAPLSRLTPAATDLTVAQALDAVARAAPKYVGVFATDVRDRLFLAREVDARCPGATLFFLESDVLLLHPTELRYLRGAIVTTTYPLFRRNQYWTSPEEPRSLSFFSSGTAVGVYNAALALLGMDVALAEYQSPDLGFGPDPWDGPPVWLARVGNGLFAPLTARAPDAARRSYLHAASRPRRPLERERFPLRAPMTFHYTTLALILACFAAVLAFGLANRGRVFGRRPRLRILSWLELSPGAPVGQRHQRAFFLGVAFGTLFLVQLLFFGLTVQRLAVSDPSDGHAGAWIYGLASAAATVVILLAGVRALAAAARIEIESVWNAFGSWCLCEGWNGSSLVLPAGIFWLAILAVLAWKVVAPFSGAATGALQAAIDYERATSLANGLSPLPTVLVLALAVSFLIALNLRRLTLSRRLTPESPFRRLAGSLGGAAKREAAVVGNLESLWPSVGLLLVLVGVSLAVADPVRGTLGPILDPPGVAWLFASGGAVVLVGSLAVAVRFQRTWRSLAGFLDVLARHPVAQAFDRLPAAWARFVGTDAAGRLPRLPDLAAAVATWRALRDGFPAVETEVVARLALTPGALEAVRQELDKVVRAESHLSRGLAASGPTEPLDTGTRRAVLNRLAGVTKALAEAHEGVWALGRTAASPRKGADGIGTAPKDAADAWLRNAESLLAYQTAAFVSAILSQMRGLVAAPLASVILLFLAVAFYPFQPIRPLLLSVGLLAVGMGAVAVSVLFSVNRNEVISRMTDGRPGKIDWSPALVLRVLTTAVFPLLGLLASRLPGVQTSVAELLANAARVLK